MSRIKINNFTVMFENTPLHTFLLFHGIFER